MEAFVVAFESTHAAMAAGRALKDAGVAYMTIPTPRAISAGCGIAQRFEAATNDEARSLLSCSGVSLAQGALFLQTSHDGFERIAGESVLG